MRRLLALLLVGTLAGCSLPTLEFQRTPTDERPTAPQRPVAHAYGPPLPAGSAVVEPPARRNPARSTRGTSRAPCVPTPRSPTST